MNRCEFTDKTLALSDAYIIHFTFKEKLVTLLISKNIPPHHPFRHMDCLAV